MATTGLLKRPQTGIDFLCIHIIALKKSVFLTVLSSMWRAWRICSPGCTGLDGIGAPLVARDSIGSRLELHVHL